MSVSLDFQCGVSMEGGNEPWIRGLDLLGEHCRVGLHRRQHRRGARLRWRKMSQICGQLSSLCLGHDCQLTIIPKILQHGQVGDFLVQDQQGKRLIVVGALDIEILGGTPLGRLFGAKVPHVHLVEWGWWSGVVEWGG